VAWEGMIQAIGLPSTTLKDANLNILCLDLAVSCGVSRGAIGSIPETFSVRLAKRGYGEREPSIGLAKFLVKSIRESRPDIIVVEHVISPAAQFGKKSDKFNQTAQAIASQERLHGVVYAISGLYGIRLEEPYSATVRKFVLGQGRAKEGQNIKDLVVSRMKLLGYLPKDSNDHNAADAASLFVYAESVYCRKSPSSLVLFG
jgi:Holliday junction resolvasome RuvABC endonuclease subunit